MVKVKPLGSAMLMGGSLQLVKRQQKSVHDSGDGGNDRWRLSRQNRSRMRSEVLLIQSFGTETSCR